MASLQRVWSFLRRWRRDPLISLSSQGQSKADGPEAARVNPVSCRLSRLNDFRSFKTVIRDKEVAQHRDDEGVMNPDMVNQDCLQLGNHRAAHDRNDE